MPRHPSVAVLAAPLALVGACSGVPAPTETPNDAATPPPPTTTAPEGAGHWTLAASGAGRTLLLAGVGTGVADRPRIHLFCPAHERGTLLVNVPAFEPVASEERLSIGAGGIVAALVADPAGDARRGGVSATGMLPADLPLILRSAEGVRVTYGAQTLGPLPGVAPRLADDFVRACVG